MLYSESFETTNSPNCLNEFSEDETITIRRLGSTEQETLDLDTAIKQISKKNKLPIN